MQHRNARIDEQRQKAYKVEDAKESEKEMEQKVGAAMEKIKILDLDFGKVLEGREEISRAALELIRVNIKLPERQEFEWSMRRNRIFVLGKTTKEKVFEGRTIHTVPILLSCPCIGDKERLERILRNAGIRASFHWPQGMLEYVRGIKERVEGMGHGGQEEYVRVRALREEGRLVLRADVRYKEGGRFRWVGDWLCPPLNRELWTVCDDILKPHRKPAVAE